MKKAIPVFLSCLMLLSVCAVSAAAAETSTGTFSTFCYNVSGLPSLSFLSGGDDVDVLANQTDIGKFINENGYDIVAVQEDFGYHKNLLAPLTSYNYFTLHHGGVPSGDGTNIFTKTYKMYNEEHITWNMLYGLADDGADEFSQKGITYCCIEIAEGVYVDFYNIHADAYGDEGSVAARTDNFKQLSELINNRSENRAVIVTGDFNEYIEGDTSNIRGYLLEDAGLKDAWVEVKNGGNYNDFTYWKNTMGSSWGQKWGHWDSVERFMYKNGDNVTLSCNSFEYVTVLNRKGVSASDHNAAAATFTYTVTGSGDSGEGLEVKAVSMFEEYIRRIVKFFEALFLAIANFDAIKDYLAK